MQVLPAFDQRFVRYTPAGFKSANSNCAICTVCGVHDRCASYSGLQYMRAASGIIARIDACPAYVPVLSFQDETGLGATFDTFRRGEGWFRRVRPGCRVKLMTAGSEDFIGEGRVTETYCGPLGTMLEAHAGMNHLMRDGMYPDAEIRLQRILTQIYGRNYAMPDKIFSVIYVEPNT